MWCIFPFKGQSTRQNDMQKCLHKKLLIPPHCLSVLCFSPLCVFFLCFWDWEKPVLINMTWISFCQAYRQFLLWFKSVECEVVYGNQGRPMYYGNVAKLLWYFRNYRNKMRFDMFVCDRSDSHVPFFRHWSAMLHQTGLFFHVCELFVACWKMRTSQNQI